MTINIKALEKIIKGAANHWRLKILFLLKEEADLSLASIAEKLKDNPKTISEHTKKLAASGLLDKRYRNRAVLHSLSDLGQKTLLLIQRLI